MKSLQWASVGKIFSDLATDNAEVTKMLKWTESDFFFFKEQRIEKKTDKLALVLRLNSFVPEFDFSKNNVFIFNCQWKIEVWFKEERKCSL